jgi:hypothetical protein
MTYDEYEALLSNNGDVPIPVCLVYPRQAIEFTGYSIWHEKCLRIFDGCLHSSARR